MSAPDYFDDHDEWVECWQCGGDGLLEDCFEDTCVCLDPPCIEKRCDVCRGKGGWSLPEPEASHPQEPDDVR